MLPSEAKKHLEELGYKIADTTPRGGQRWELGTNAIYIPGPSGIQVIPDEFINHARKHALGLSIEGLPVIEEK